MNNSYFTEMEIIYNSTQYLSIADEKNEGFPPFLRALSRSETQKASSRTWTRLAMSISFDDNQYATPLFPRVRWANLKNNNITGIFTIVEIKQWPLWSLSLTLSLSQMIAGK